MKFLWFLLFLIVLLLAIKEIDQRTNGTIKEVEFGVNKSGRIWINYQDRCYVF